MKKRMGVSDKALKQEVARMVVYLNKILEQNREPILWTLTLINSVIVLNCENLKYQNPLWK